MQEPSAVERWLPIPGWEGYYEASDHGRVRSVDRVVRDKKGRERRLRSVILQPWAGPGGHLIVHLFRHGAGVQFGVHQLVLLTFVGPCPTGKEGCHWDGVPSNNWVGNLRWDTASANALDRVRHGTHQMTRRTCCPRDHPLVQPNLVACIAREGRRSCLACSRASSDASYAELNGHTINFQAVADEHFQRIIAGAVSGTYRDKRRCPRSHPLYEPNLVPSAIAMGRHDCLACNRAKGNERYARKTGRPFDLQAEADRQYQKILNGAASGKARTRTICDRGHLLQSPNLTTDTRAGRRSCLACERARGNEKYAKRVGKPFDTEAAAARHYASIMTNHMGTVDYCAADRTLRDAG